MPHPGSIVSNVQILRFAAAFAVIFAHSFDLALSGSPRALGWFSPDFKYLGAVGVDIFFVISGYIIATTAFRSKSAWEFAWKRFRRVVPLYYLLSIPWLLIALYSGESYKRELLVTFTFWPAIGKTILEPVHDGGWTLNFEMLFYVSMTLVLLIRKPWALGAVIATYASFWIARELTGIAAFRHLGNPIILEFALGVLVAFVAPRLKIELLGLPSLLLGLAALIASAVIGHGQISEMEFTTNGERSLDRVLVWGIPSALIVFGAVTMRDWGSRNFFQALVFLGNASYSLYLVHTMAMFVLEFLIPESMPALAVLLMAVLFALAAGVAVHVIIERPLLRAMSPAERPVLKPALI